MKHLLPPVQYGPAILVKPLVITKTIIAAYPAACAVLQSLEKGHDYGTALPNR
jgi:hypothetical protein